MSTDQSLVHFLIYFLCNFDVFYTFSDILFTHSLIYIFYTFSDTVNNSNSSSASSSTDSIEPELLFNRNSGHFCGNSPSFGSNKKSSPSTAKGSKTPSSKGSKTPSSKGSKTPSSVGSEASSVPQELECRLLLDQVLNEKKLVINN